MPLNPAQAKAAADSIIHQASVLFYNGGTPTVFGMAVTSALVIDPGLTPNGNLTPTAAGTAMGVEVSQGLLNMPATTAKFAIGHELGHAFSETILNKVNMAGTSGAATEVIADLTSAYVLVQGGESWANVLAAVNGWSASGLFDANRMGDHPPGAQRAGYVRALHAMMTHATLTRSFEAAAKLICRNC